MPIVKEVERHGNTITLDGTPLVGNRRVSTELGYVELRQNARLGVHVAVSTNEGRLLYEVQLRRDGKYQLDEQRGRFINSAETDPIKRVVQAANVPLAKLRKVFKPMQEVKERWYDNSNIGQRGKTINVWFHDGTATEGTCQVLERPVGNFKGGGYRNFSIIGATYAFSVDYGQGEDGKKWSRVSLVYTWPRCNPSQLATEIAKRTATE